MKKSPKQATYAPTSTIGGTQLSQHTGAGQTVGGIGLALDLGWQLLVVVCGPIVVGRMLDNRYDSFPVWSLVGMAVATAALLGVIMRMNAKMQRIQRSDSKEKRT